MIFKFDYLRTFSKKSELSLFANSFCNMGQS
jgi:hypothetical protein